MASRCLNRVALIGNLTRDPELRYTPSGMAVCSFGLATNRTWVTKQGERKEDAQFHRIVAWNKLAELCSQLLAKGRRAYVEGRLQYRDFVDQEGNKKLVAEIVIDDMIILDNKGSGAGEGPEDIDLAGGQDLGGEEELEVPDEIIPDEDGGKSDGGKEAESTVDEKTEEVPF